MKSLTIYPILILFCLTLYVPGLFSLPPTDRDESRYAQSSRQMLEDNDFVGIRFQDRPRHKKPVGIYWLQAASAAATGMAGHNRIWPYRIPSLLGAVAAVLLTFYFGRRLFGRDTAFLGAALAAGSLLLIAQAHLATTDAVLLAASVAAQGALALSYTGASQGRRKNSAWWVFWAAQGIGILVKGPILPFFSALTIGALLIADRRAGWLKSLRPAAGIPLALAIAAPWFIAVQAATEGRFLLEGVLGDLLPKIVSGHESHGFPPGYYLLLMSVTCWPMSIFTLPAAFHAWRRRLRPEIRFCLAWIVPAWVLFEIVPTKLPHYLLPLYPAMALLTANAIIHVARGPENLLHTRAARIGFAIWSLVTVAIAGVSIVLPWLITGGFKAGSLWPAGTAVIILCVVISRIARERPMAAVVAALAGTALMLAPVLQNTLPAMNELWLSRAVAEAVERHTGKPPYRAAPLAAAGYHEPSLVFLCGTRTSLTTPKGAARHLARHSGALAVVSNDLDPDFHAAMASLGQKAALVETLHGLNYTKGRRMTLRLYALDPARTNP
ncbi:MAG: glycosyltransferase family 39 protein [Deltaproteobacteria bacterium]|nr:glycosyltransferase family 39 protein [Deltaproteobacteria bacterium]